MVFKFIVLSLLVSTALSTNPGHLTVNPGIITVITSKGLHYGILCCNTDMIIIDQLFLTCPVSALAKDEIQHELNPAKIKIPNQSGELGFFKYHIKEYNILYCFQ